MIRKLDEYTRAALVLAVRNGTASRRNVLERYAISEEELLLWEAAFDDDGIAGLRGRRLVERRGNNPAAFRRDRLLPDLS